MKITLQNIRKQFGNTVALDDLSLEFADGKLTTLLGPSGCGKSTLLNLISGILPPTSGKIYFGDREVTALSPDKRNIGLVFQNYALYPHMTVCENIAFPLEIKKVSKQERTQRARELAKLLKIEDYFMRKPSQLSGGQQQRVAIARALAKEPEILLLDEPLSNLDARLRLEMREEIRRLQLETGITTIFVTHDQEEALSISDYILLLKKGRIQQYGLPQELYDQPCNPFVADFLGNPPINFYDAVVENGRAVLAEGDEAAAAGDAPAGSGKTAAKDAPAGIRKTADGMPVGGKASAAGDVQKTGFTIPGLTGIAAGRKIKLGIRSEAFEAAEEGVYETPATVDSVFLNGKETLYLLKIGGKSFRGTLEGGQTYAAGTKISVRLKKKGVHIYDSETEEKLA